MTNSEIKKWKTTIRDPDSDDLIRKWETKIIKDPESDSDDYFIEFPDELMLAANLKIGDVLQCEAKGSSLILTKVSRTRVLINRLRDVFIKFFNTTESKERE